MYYTAVCAARAGTNVLALFYDDNAGFITRKLARYGAAYNAPSDYAKIIHTYIIQHISDNFNSITKFLKIFLFYRADCF